MFLSGATLHHMGFVVKDLEDSIAGFQRSTEAAWDGRIWEDPLQRVRVAFLKVAGNPVEIELVSPLSQDSPVARFLEHGGGLHHICYEVPAIEQCVADMVSLGNLVLQSPMPAVAFGNRRIVWLITREKLLIELLESSRGGIPAGSG